MRLLFVHNRYQKLGGEDLAARAEIELLASHGHTVDLFEVNNADITGLTAKASTALGAVYSFASKRKLAARIRYFRPTLVHTFNFFPLLSPSIHYACREANVPVVQKISNFRLICPGGLLLRNGRVCEDCVSKSLPWPGVLHACYRDSRIGSSVVATMLAVHRLLATWDKVVHAYIARTNFSRNKLIEGGLPERKIAIIPSFAADPGEPGSGAGGFALFAGRLSQEKGIATLLSAWDHLQGLPLRLKVAGDGPLREEVRRRAALGRIEYLGALRRSDVQSLMQEAAFLIFPSDCYENFPLSIVEAFASGVPVIASRIGAMEEIIEDGRTGLHFCAGDSEDLAAKIQWAVRHGEDMARMRMNARAEYLAKYTAERNYRLTLDLYDRVTGATPAA